MAIHNVPGEGDVSAVLVGHLEVADNFLGTCKSTSRKLYSYKCAYQFVAFQCT